MVLLICLFSFYNSFKHHYHSKLVDMEEDDEYLEFYESYPLRHFTIYTKISHASYYKPIKY